MLGARDDRRTKWYYRTGYRIFWVVCAACIAGILWHNHATRTDGYGYPVHFKSTYEKQLIKLGLPPSYAQCAVGWVESNMSYSEFKRDVDASSQGQSPWSIQELHDACVTN